MPAPHHSVFTGRMPFLPPNQQRQSTEDTGKINEKLKSENVQKRAVFLCLHYILRAIRAGRCRERRYADHIYSYIFQNAPFRSQIFKIFFASGSKGALTL